MVLWNPQREDELITALQQIRTAWQGRNPAALQHIRTALQGRNPAALQHIRTASQGIPAHHSASQRITVHYKTSQCITAHYSALQDTTGHYKTSYSASQDITTHHNASHGHTGKQASRERAHKFREKCDKKSKVPRKRVRNLTFPCKSTEEERTRIRTVIYGRTNERTRSN